MIDIYKNIIELNQQGINMVLCTVIGTKGSTPLKSGAKMIVTADNNYGTVGGGSTENQTINEARKLLNTIQSKKIDIELISKEDTSCGGFVEVYLEPISQNFQLYIFGGGHVARALVDVCRNIGFDITVIDDRKEIIDEWNIKGCKTVYSDFLKFIEETPFNNKSFITIMSYEHKRDWDILSKCVNCEWAYLGLMGSKHKIKGMRKKLFDLGVEEDIINKIDMPIGIEIQSESAKEIAVSITAKLISVKNTIIKEL